MVDDSVVCILEFSLTIKIMLLIELFLTFETLSPYLHLQSSDESQAQKLRCCRMFLQLHTLCIGVLYDLLI